MDPLEVEEAGPEQILEVLEGFLIEMEDVLGLHVPGDGEVDQVMREVCLVWDNLRLEEGEVAEANILSSVVDGAGHGPRLELVPGG